MNIRQKLLDAKRPSAQRIYYIDVGSEVVPVLFVPPKERRLVELSHWRERTRARQDDEGLQGEIPADVAMNAKMVIECVHRPKLDDENEPVTNGLGYVSKGPVFEATDLEVLCGGAIGSWQSELRDQLGQFVTEVSSGTWEPEGNSESE